MANNLRRTAALTLSAIMTVNLCTVGLSTPAIADEVTQGARVCKADIGEGLPESRFTIKNNEYMTRLRQDFDGVVKLNLAFNEYSDSDEVLMTNDDGHKFMDMAKIQVNSGDTWTFKDAGLVLSNYGTESNSCFETTNKDFIRQFIMADTLNVAILDYEGGLVEGTLPNQLDLDQRKAFVEAYDGAASEDVDKAALTQAIARANELNLFEYTEPSASAVRLNLAKAEEVLKSKTASQEEVNKACDALTSALDGLVKAEELKIIAAGYDSENSQWSDKWGITFNQPAKDFNDKVAAGLVKSIEVNGVVFEGTKAISDNFSYTLTVKNLYVANSFGEAQPAFEKSGKDGSAHVLITFTDGSKLEFAGDSEIVDPEVPDTPDAKKQTGTVDIAFMKDGQDSPSMADVMFGKKAEVSVDNDTAKIRIFVAYPIPAFPDAGEGGTLKDFKVSYKGTDYLGTSDTSGKFEMEVKKSNAYFGLVEGETISAQAIDIELPKEALTESKLDASCFVNVVMKSSVDFDMLLSNLQLEDVKEPVDPETPVDPGQESTDSFNTAQARLVKFADHGTESMSGATMEKQAQVLLEEDGSCTVITHFKPAVINGILAYATDLSVDDELSHEFILAEDNSAVCITKLASFDQANNVLDAHIYSSVMDSEVALELSSLEKKSNLADALETKVSEAEKKLAEGTYYEKTEKALTDAIEQAKSSSSSKSSSYANIVSAMANLREKLDNPFVGDSLFFVNAKDTSVVGSKLLEPKVRVDVSEDGTTTFSGTYGASHQWWGLSKLQDFKVFADDGRTIEIPVENTIDNQGNLHFSFSVKDIPASGIFKTRIHEVDGRGPISSDLVLDYASIVKGPQKSFLQDAIKEALSYQRYDWNGTGDISEIKDDFTEKSWNAFMDVINNAKDDLKTDMTQDEIDEDIAQVKAARKSLRFKKAAGSGNIANASTSGLNNPNNYFTGGDYQEMPVTIGWMGSKIVFGENGDVYRVLNNGIEIEDGVTQNTGKLLIMADTARVKAAFANEAPENLKSATRWDSSYIRQYLNGDYLNKNFNKAQTAAILDSSITTEFEKNPYGEETLDPIETVDKIFAPSVAMLRSPAYGYGSNDGRSCDDSYGLRNIYQDGLGDIVVMGIQPKGRVEGVFKLNSDKYSTAPCMNIDASRVLMTVDAETGLKKGLQKNNALETNLWKLVLKDDSLSLSDIKARVDNNKVSFTANTNASDFAAAIVEGDSLDTGAITYFGQVSPDGFELPSDFNSDIQKLFIMGIENTKGSIGATEAQLVDIVVTPDPETPDKPNPDDGAILAGTVDVDMYQDGKDQRSMSDDMFAQTADVVVDKDIAKLILYVAYPIPAFPDKGKDGTLTNFSISYNGVDYKGVSDTSGHTMEVKKTNNYFGLKAGDTISAQTLTFTLPREAIDQSKLDASCFVNVVMESQVDFDIHLSNLNLTEVEQPTDPTDPEVPSHDIIQNTLGDNGRLIIQGDADLFRAQGSVNVDGQDLKKDDYTITSGSTIISLSSKFMESLKPGQHVLTADFKDGSSPVVVKFTTKAKDGGGTDVPGGGVVPGGGTTPGGGSEKPSDTNLDFSHLADGTYSVTADMYKLNKQSESMANKTLDHNVKIEVKGGKYYATLNFEGLKVGAKMGYLGKFKYYDGAGNLREAQVLQTRTVDGKTYPKTVRIELNQEAIRTGWQKVQVFVQTMEDIASGTGTQDVYLKFNTKTIKKGHNPGDSFYGTISDTQGKRKSFGGTPATSDAVIGGKEVCGMVLAGAAALGLSRKKDESDKA